MDLNLAHMIKASRYRILVKMVPVTEELLNSLHLTLVDQKKHWDHTARKGVVQSVGGGVYGIRVGDVVVFRGDAGFSMDGDPEFAHQDQENSYRWLKRDDCLAILEPVMEKIAEAV